MSFTWVDYAIILIMLVSMLVGLIRGFVKEVVLVIIWIVGVIVAVRYSPMLSEIFTTMVHSPHARLVMSFAILMLAILLLGALANYILSKTLEKSGLTGTDRVIGLVFGLIRGIVLVGALILFAHLTVLPKTPAFIHSYLAPHFMIVSDWLKHLIPTSYDNYFKYIVK